MVLDDQSNRLEKLKKLSQNELSVLSRFCQGQEYKQIAGELHFAEPTIKRYMQKICIKLEIDTLTVAERRAELFTNYCSLVNQLRDSEDNKGAEPPNATDSALPADGDRLYKRATIKWWIIWLLSGGVILLVGFLIGRLLFVPAEQQRLEAIQLGTFTFTSGSGQETGRKEIPIGRLAPGRYRLTMQNGSANGSETWLVWDYLALKSGPDVIWEIGEAEAPPDFSATAFDEFCDPNTRPDCQAEFKNGLTPAADFVGVVNDRQFPTVAIDFEISDQQAAGPANFILVLSTLYATHEGADRFQMEIRLDRYESS